MSGFTHHSGRIAVLPDDDIDTDRIIPARFLSMVTRTGYGELLFKDVRGPSFPLDLSTAVGASILVVGSNFGCGSSREHAVWAIQQAGFVAVIARVTATSAGYSDIFRQNAANCGLLLIELSDQDHLELVGAGQGAQVEIDLENQTVEVSGRAITFEIAAATKEQMLRGLDLVGTTLVHEIQIADFERQSQAYVPKGTAVRPMQ